MSSKYCIGDLDQEVILHNRVIVAPLAGEIAFDSSSTESLPVWAKVKTRSGKTWFNTVDAREYPLTHELIVMFDASIEDGKTWVECNGKRLEILSSENINEENEYLKLLCSATGGISEPGGRA